MKVAALLSCVVFCLSSLPVMAYNFENALEDSIQTDITNDEINLDRTLERRAIDTGGAEEVRDAIVWAVAEVLIPLFVFIGVIAAITGFYKIMTSKNDKELAKGMNYLLWGTIGIIVMVTAGYIVNQLVGQDGMGGIFGGGDGGLRGSERVAGGQIVDQVYVKVFFPLVKLAIYLILGILFIMAVIAGFRYMFNADEAAQKKALLTLTRTTLGVIVIILAKEIVEAVYGPYQTIVNTNIDNLGDIGQGVFQKPEIPLVYTVINRILGIAMFIVVIIIIYQGYLLLARPTDDSTAGKLKKNLLYVFIGILVIGAGYLLSNFFIIK